MYIITNEQELERANKAIEIATRQARKSTCHRSKCGSVVVSGNEYEDLLGVGYNSMPCNVISDCFKDNLPKGFKSDKTCCIHAEQRAIMQASHNPQIKGSRLYFIRLDENDNPKHSGKPYCTICSKFALDAGVKEFVLWHKEGFTVYDTDEYNKLSFQYVE